MIDCRLYDILLAPVLSEKATSSAESGKYVFKVAGHATRRAVHIAVQSIFNVQVKKVNMVNLPAKIKVFKGRKGKRSAIKKAIVTLVQGETLNLVTN